MIDNTAKHAKLSDLVTVCTLKRSLMNLSVSGITI